MTLKIGQLWLQTHPSKTRTHLKKNTSVGGKLILIFLKISYPCQEGYQPWHHESSTVSVSSIYKQTILSSSREYVLHRAYLSTERVSFLRRQIAFESFNILSPPAYTNATKTKRSVEDSHSPRKCPWHISGSSTPVNSKGTFQPLSKQPGIHIKKAARHLFDLCYYLDLVSYIKRVQCCQTNSKREVFIAESKSKNPYLL